MIKNLHTININRRLPVASRNAGKAFATGNPTRPGESVITTSGIFRHSGFSAAAMFYALTSVPGLLLFPASPPNRGKAATGKGGLPAISTARSRFRKDAFPCGTGRDRSVSCCLSETIKGGTPMVN